MTYNEKETERKFKSEQHAQMTAAIALLKYGTAGYHCSAQFMPSDTYSGQKYARFEVDIYHDYWEIIEPCEYLMPNKIQERLYEKEEDREAYGCTTFVYIYGE